MDNTKLNELAAKAYGLEWFEPRDKDERDMMATGGWGFSIDGPLKGDWLKAKNWNPATCADDALTLLDKVANGKHWRLDSVDALDKYTCTIYDTDKVYVLYEAGDTAAIAMTVMSLRAAGIPETEIQEALK